MQYIGRLLPITLLIPIGTCASNALTLRDINSTMTLYSAQYNPVPPDICGALHAPELSMVKQQRAMLANSAAP